MTKTRLKVLYYWLRGKKNQVGMGELLHYFFAPSYLRKANDVITKIDEVGDFIAFTLKGIKEPVYYPRSMDLQSMRQVIVESFYEDNWHYYQVPETKVTSHDIVADCGAAEGLFSLIASTVCKKCYLIEPLPEYVKALELTFEHIQNAKIIACALSDHPGTATIRGAGISSSITNEKMAGTKICIETIDALFYEKNLPVTYLKIDLEGYDYKCILGAQKTIEKYRPKIAIATYHHPDHADQLHDLLEKISPRYRFKTKGIYQKTGSPVMLHAWPDSEIT